MAIPGFFSDHMIFLTALSLLLPALFFAATILSRRLKKNRKDKKYHPIAGTMFNQLLNFNRLHHYMTRLAAKHRTYRLLSPFRNEVYTSDPANVEYILKTNFNNYGKVSYNLWTDLSTAVEVFRFAMGFPTILHFLQGDYNYSLLSDLLGDGIFTVDGDKWRQQRKIASYEFSTKVLRDFSSVVFRKNAVKLANILSEVATNEQVVDMQVKALLNSI